MKRLPSQKNETYQSVIGRVFYLINRFFYSQKASLALGLVIFGVFVFSAINIRKLSTEYSMKQFYPQNHSILKTDSEIKKIFQVAEKSPFLYLVEMPSHLNWMDKSRIKKLQNLSNKLSDIQGVQQVVTMASIEGASQSKDQIAIGNFFDRTLVSNWKNEVKKNALIYPLFLSEDLRTTIVAVYTESTTSERLKQYDKVFKGYIQQHFPQTAITSGGVPVIQSQLSQLIRSELSLFFGVALLVFCLLFYMLFSHISAVIAAFLVLFISQVAAIGFLVPFGISMNVILSTLPIIISVSVMSLLIHTFHLWSEKQKLCDKMIYENRWKHSVETLKELFLPNLLGSLTTAFGFLALVPSEIPIIKQYGWVVFLLVSGFAIFGQVLVLLALPWVKPSMRKWFDEKAQWALFPIHHSKLILSGVVSVFLISLIGIPFLNFSGKLFTDLPPEHPAQRATLKLDERNGGLISYDLMLSAEEDGFFKKQENIYKIQRLTQYLRQDPRFGSVISLPDLFQGPIPKTQDAISETLFLFTMAEKNPLTGFVTEDGKKLRLMIRFNDQTSQTIFLLRQWIADSVKTFIPNVKLSEGGMAVAHHTINQMVAKDLIFTFWHPLILIGVLLIIVFRSFRWALTACLPNLIPPVVLVGAMAFSQVVVKPSVALVFAIALGFAFNNTIYLLARLRKQNELRETMLVEGNPCAFESLVMFLGFSVFIFSQFNVNKLFGLFMMISIFVGFVGDLLFLPAFLSRYPQWLGLNLNSNQSEVKTKLRLISDKLNEDKEKVATFEEEEEVTRYYPAASVVLGLIFLGTTVGPNALAVTQSQRNRMPASLPNQSHSSGSGVTSTELNSRSVSLSAEDILRKSQTQLDAKDDQAIIELKIIEKNGEEKVRKIDYKSRRKKNFAVLAKIMSPADVKGMSFLGLVEGGEESQWIYIPSSRQVRRVVTGGTKAGLLGSEISAEDLNSQAVKHSKAELIPGSGNYYQIQVVPAKGTSSYSKIISYLSKDQFLPIRADYYVGTKLKKTIEFKEYTKVGPVYRAQKLFVSNLLNGRKTEVKFAGLKVNSGLSEEEFTQNALKKNR